METWLLIVIAGFAGAAAGALITWFALPRGFAGRDSQKAREELERYREDVAQHFAKTAQLVNTMTDSYKDVYEHLREGAHELLSEEQLRSKLADQSDEIITLQKLGGSAESAGGPPSPVESSSDASAAGSSKESEVEPDEQASESRQQETEMESEVEASATTDSTAEPESDDVSSDDKAESVSAAGETNSADAKDDEEAEPERTRASA